DHADRQAMPERDAINLVLDRAGVGVDIDAGGGVQVRHMRWIRAGLYVRAWYSIGFKNARKTRAGNTLATAHSSRTIWPRNDNKIRGNRANDQPARNLPRPGLQHVKSVRKQDP